MVRRHRPRSPTKKTDGENYERIDVALKLMGSDQSIRRTGLTVREVRIRTIASDVMVKDGFHGAECELDRRQLISFAVERRELDRIRFIDANTRCRC
jgi:hypothetical protein